jgi:predicted RNase H-like HicB family nuclease
MRTYIALIHKDKDSDFGVSFPDFPGVVTAGLDLDDARQMAEEALNLHIRGMMEDKDVLPEPSTLEKVMEETDNRQGVAMLIPVKMAETKSVRVNLTFNADILAKIDAAARKQGLSRSAFLAMLARKEIDDPSNAKGNALAA